MNKNYYETLYVPKSATFEEIKKSYRKLSLIHHPDKNGNSPESINKMNDINEAYEILSNPETKYKYDNGIIGDHIGDQVPVDINELFANMFSQSFDNAQFNRGPPTAFKFFFGNHSMAHVKPIIKIITIPFEKVLLDLKIPVEIQRIIQDGNQQNEETEIIYVDVPKGIDDGEMLIVKEKGNIINNIKGDLKIVMKIDNQTEYKRAGLDLIFEKTITLKEALCGFDFKLKHLSGKIYTITNSNTVGRAICQNYTIQNLGLSRENYVGNLVIIFNIKYPESLSESVVEELKKIDF